MILAGALAALLVGVMAATWPLARRARPNEGAAPGPTAIEAADPNEAYYATMVVPEFTLVDQDGSARTKEMLRGRVTILAFTFTHCTTVCPVMMSNLIRMQEELNGTPVRLLSITVDPERDTPEVLRRKAASVGADLSRWTFLTGDRGTVERIVSGLCFFVADDPSLRIPLPDGTEMNNIVHPSKFVLIGPEGTVRGLEDGNEWSGAARMLARAKRLARGG
jgi:protein SCO1/2